VYFVHGCDGMDEITVNNESRLYRYSTKSHQMTISACDPTLYDCRHDTFPTIQTRSDAVDLFLQTLAGIAPPSINSLVALNAAYAMLLYSPENTISEGVKEVKKALQSGKVKNHLHRIARISQL
jgi:anthranilate phosphoribosyltransferase